MCKITLIYTKSSFVLEAGKLIYDQMCARVSNHLLDDTWTVPAYV